MCLSVATTAATFVAVGVPLPELLPLEADAASDSSLLLLIEQRNEVAMGRVFERHSRLVYSVAVRVLHDPAQAEDVLQEVFMQLWKKPVKLDLGRGNLRALLAVMARNRSLDLLRKRKQTQSTDEFDMPSSFNLSNDSEQRLLLDRILKIAGDLPAEQQSVFGLAFLEGLTHAQIATQTRTPLGTVKARIRSAVQSLRRTLTHDYERAPGSDTPMLYAIELSQQRPANTSLRTSIRF